MDGLCNMSWRNWFNCCWLQMIWDRGGCCHYHKLTSQPWWIKVWSSSLLSSTEHQQQSNTISIQASSPVSAVRCSVVWGETKATGEDKLSWKQRQNKKQRKNKKKIQTEKQTKHLHFCMRTLSPMLIRTHLTYPYPASVCCCRECSNTFSRQSFSQQWKIVKSSIRLLASSSSAILHFCHWRLAGIHSQRTAPAEILGWMTV